MFGLVDTAREQAGQDLALLPTAVQGAPEHLPENAGHESAKPLAGQVMIPESALVLCPPEKLRALVVQHGVAAAGVVAWFHDFRASFFRGESVGVVPDSESLSVS